jgi:hypothetical protein
VTGVQTCALPISWKEKWFKINWDIKFWEVKIFNKTFKSKVDYNNYLSISEQIKLNTMGLKTWAIFWYLSVIYNDGFCLNPNYSYVRNFGDDGSGSNRGFTNTNKVTKLNESFSRKIPCRIKELKISNYFIKEAYMKRNRLRCKGIKMFIFRNLVAGKIIKNL